VEAVWIGLFEVAPRPGTEFPDKGAYVNVVGPARTAADFERKVRAALAEAGFELINVENRERLEHRLTKRHVDPELIVLADESRRMGAVRLAEFHSWVREEE